MTADEFFTFKRDVFPLLRTYYGGGTVERVPTWKEQKQLLEAFAYVEQLHRSGGENP